MKLCPYCGKKYSDEVSVCAIDEHNLVAGEPGPVSATQEPTPVTKEDAIYLTFPDYHWSARDAWKYIGISIILIIAFLPLYWVLEVPFPRLRALYESGLGFFFGGLLHYSVYLTVAAYFARTETLATFFKGFGFDRKPSEYVWFGVVCALTIRFIGHFMLAHGWGKGVSNYDVHMFRTTVGSERFFYLVPLVLLAPLFEEAIYRGFLYKAFRGSFSIYVSMALIVGWTVWNHWPQYSTSWIAAFDLSLITIVQCHLREKSGSLWDCIFCHLAFNASSLFIGATPR